MKTPPAPWAYGVRKDGSIYISCGNPNKGAHAQFDIATEDEDIARMMAAAPELYEALAWLRSNYAGGSTREINARIDAALAKARGEPLEAQWSEAKS